MIVSDRRGGVPAYWGRFIVRPENRPGESSALDQGIRTYVGPTSQVFRPDKKPPPVRGVPGGAEMNCPNSKGDNGFRQASSFPLCARPAARRQRTGLLHNDALIVAV